MTETHLWCVCVLVEQHGLKLSLICGGRRLGWKNGVTGVEVFCGLLFGLISLNVTGASVLLLLSR